jgi:hypothetical protein
MPIKLVEIETDQVQIALRSCTLSLVHTSYHNKLKDYYVLMLLCKERFNVTCQLQIAL